LFAVAARELSQMRIVKRWRDDTATLEAQGQPTGWFEITMEDCIRHTEGNGYFGNGTVREMLLDGATISTPWADYKMEV
jgi:hypothetical protein